ncbi:predicted protein [Postia placenta Mad-698-R]|uniref:Uncharacterized protein n=1 Tax=Postia placenta MAD-698-R-SB12 TaxID=670580 RepID=A0A1X6N623_9APHY|nr:hypothetical protein POSPLADRAFT_1138001 [Postia placenta MAD-698-R-SB12]EED78972.1 predicted protein [Postia placenta Mad-698-R]OSX64044.1 hypothetical protein POSPLADRAFT_1138001 [Postia placenta MAD-698-R-SB12]
MASIIVPQPQAIVPARPAFQHWPYQVQKKVKAIGKPFTNQFFTWKIQGYNAQQEQCSDTGGEPDGLSQQSICAVLVPFPLPPPLPLREQRTIPVTWEPSGAPIHDASSSSDYDMRDASSDSDSERGVVPPSDQPAALHCTRLSPLRDLCLTTLPAELATQRCSQPASPDPALQELRRTVRTTLTTRRSRTLRHDADGKNRLDGRSQRRLTRPTLPSFGHVVRTTAIDCTQQRPQHRTRPYSCTSRYDHCCSGCCPDTLCPFKVFGHAQPCRRLELSG